MEDMKESKIGKIEFNGERATHHFRLKNNINVLISIYSIKL